KRLFVCCDGTWQNASGTVAPLTNVARLARCVDRYGYDKLKLPNVDSVKRGDIDPEEYAGVVPQLVYYSSGIGTQSALPFDKGLSGAIGKGVTSNILSAYCFICNNYNFASEMDEIVLVGFSRGAFTVRCLASFISEVGLLRRKGLTFLRILFQHWLLQETGPLKDKIDTLKKGPFNLLRSAKIKVLAEWDTVSAMGLP
ncbi:hypothetical protein AOQ84DRAFT_258435, partial [Glonium stellatum]